MFKALTFAAVALVAAVSADISDFPSFDFSHANCAIQVTYPGQQCAQTFADMKNVTGREGGAITAAQFLQRFVKPGMPWCHLDIAGTASVKTDTAFAPKGATGWGVVTLDRMIRDLFEG